MVILSRIPFQELSTAEVLAAQLPETTSAELGKMQVKKPELGQDKELYKIFLNSIQNPFLKQKWVFAL